jgi:curved DNA-binding protein CbpA
MNNKANTTKFYETLGVDKKASQEQIRQAYRKLAAKNHPDRGGDSEKVIFSHNVSLKKSSLLTKPYQTRKKEPFMINTEKKV